MKGVWKLIRRTAVFCTIRCISFNEMKVHHQYSIFTEMHAPFLPQYAINNIPVQSMFSFIVFLTTVTYMEPNIDVMKHSLINSTISEKTGRTNIMQPADLNRLWGLWDWISSCTASISEKDQDKDHIMEMHWIRVLQQSAEQSDSPVAKSTTGWYKPCIYQQGQPHLTLGHTQTPFPC